MDRIQLVWHEWNMEFYVCNITAYILVNHGSDMYIYRRKAILHVRTLLHYTHFSSFVLRGTLFVSHSEQQLSFTVLQQYEN